MTKTRRFRISIDMPEYGGYYCRNLNLTSPKGTIGRMVDMFFRMARNFIIGMMCWVGLVFAAQLSLKAGQAAALPIGRLTTSGTVSIGNVPAPTGTTLFSGDRLSAQNAPALVSLSGGSSVVLTHGAAATISRKGRALIVQAEKGIIGFHFVPSEQVRIETDRYKFTSSAEDKAEVGELTVGAGNRVSMSLSSGRFSALDTKSGESFDISSSPQAKPKSQPGGTGKLVNDTDTFSDAGKHWTKNIFRNKCIVVRGEAHRILGNKSNTLTVSGTWLLFSGTYEYTITECTAQALADAGAEIGVEDAIRVSSAQARPHGMSAGAKTAIVLGVAGGAAAGTAVAVSRKSKSP
jgi:hypothetical protein